jgi:hypothetical protein
MQRGYRYVLVAPVGRSFDLGFRRDLTPPEMLRLGVFGEKYMTDCREEFPASWFAKAKLSSERADARLNFFGVATANLFRCGAGKAGYIRTIRAAGFNGIAAIIGAASTNGMSTRRHEQRPSFDHLIDAHGNDVEFPNS